MCVFLIIKNVWPNCDLKPQLGRVFFEFSCIRVCVSPCTNHAMLGLCDGRSKLSPAQLAPIDLQSSTTCVG